MTAPQLYCDFCARVYLEVNLIEDGACSYCGTKQQFEHQPPETIIRSLLTVQQRLLQKKASAESSLKRVEEALQTFRR